MSDARTAWTAALDALELDLVETERALLLEAQADVVPEARATWTAPAEPLPAELAPRAAALLSRHQELTERLERAMAGIRRQQRRDSRLHDQLGLRSSPAPVYVDKAV